MKRTEEEEQKQDAKDVAGLVIATLQSFAAAPLLTQGIVLWFMGDNLRRKDLDVGDRISLIGRGICLLQFAYFDGGLAALLTDTAIAGGGGVLITEGVTGKRVLESIEKDNVTQAVQDNPVGFGLMSAIFGPLTGLGMAAAGWMKPETEISDYLKSLGPPKGGEDVAIIQAKVLQAMKKDWQAYLRAWYDKWPQQPTENDYA